MDDRTAVDMSKAIDDLFEYKFGVGFLHLASPLDKMKEVSAACKLHDHKVVFIAFEYFKQPDDI